MLINVEELHKVIDDNWENPSKAIIARDKVLEEAMPIIREHINCRKAKEKSDYEKRVEEATTEVNNALSKLLDLYIEDSGASVWDVLDKLSKLPEARPKSKETSKTDFVNYVRKFINM